MPVTDLSGGSQPGLATYADLKHLMLWAVCAPVQRFPVPADALVALENEDGSQVMSGLENVVSTNDVETMVKCVDGYRGINLSLGKITRITSPSSRVKATILGRHGRRMRTMSPADL